MPPLILQSHTRRTQHDVRMYCVQQQGSPARGTSDWKGQRKAWVAQQRQRRSQPPQPRQRGHHFDEDALATGTRFSAFPRMVYALERHARGSETYMGDDGFATAHSRPARGPRVDREHPSPYEADALSSGMPMESQSAGIFTVPVARRREHPESSYRRRSPSHAGTTRATSRRASATPESLLPSQIYERTAPYSGAQDRRTVASRNAPDIRANSRQPQQRAPSSPLHSSARFEDDAWPSRTERFRGHLNHTRRVQERAQQPLPHPSPRAPHASEHATLQHESGTAAASRVRHIAKCMAPQLSAISSDTSRLRARQQFGQEHTLDHSSPLGEEGCAVLETMQQMHWEAHESDISLATSHAAPQALSRNQQAASEYTSRQSYQAPLSLASGRSPSTEEQHTSDRAHSVDASSGSAHTVAIPSSPAVPAAAVWDTLSVGSDTVHVRGASHTPGGVWEKLFQQEPPASVPTAEHTPGAESDTAALDASATAPPAPSDPVQQHEDSAPKLCSTQEYNTEDAATAQATGQSSEAGDAADSALLAAAGVAGASVFLMQSLAPRNKTPPEASADAALDNSSSESAEALAAEEVPGAPHPAASNQRDAFPAEALAAEAIPEVTPDVVEAPSAVSSSVEGAAELVDSSAVDVFQQSHSLPTLDAATHGGDHLSTDSSGPDAYPSRGGIATGEVAEELVLSLEPAGSAEDSTAVLPEHGKMVLATPQMQAPQIQSSMWACAGTESSWQQQLQQQVPPRVQKVVEFAQEVTRAWHSVFPKKSEEQQRLEGEIRKAVFNGDLHWSALNEVKQGRPIVPEQIAEAKRMAQ